VVTGTFTIPAMVKIGIRPEVAGAIEATASTGGALMPPILGATCFIIVEFTGHPYSEVITWALMPALLYYICIYSTIHLETIKFKIGTSEELIQPLKKVLVQQGFIFIPLLVLLYLILRGHSPSYAAWISILVIVLVSWLRRHTRIGIKKFFIALENGGRHVVSVAMACACAGIITGVILLTGVGMTLTSLFLRLSGGSLFVLLLLSIFPLLVLGMGMPAAPAYVICASLFAPALIKAGLPVPATHFFIYYYALLSAISPPVALAAFAASSVSGASPIKTAFWSVRVAVVAYILPFTFAYSPELLMIGSLSAILIAFITAAIGTFALACAMEGILIVELNMFLRVFLAVIGIFMIVPGLMTDIIGVSIVAVILIYQKFFKRRKLLNNDKTNNGF
jgi:TRAP transporter 4TM/12TM fusion protein